MTQATYVRARIDPQLKMQASATLQGMGLSVSDAIRLMLMRVVMDKQIPFNIQSPNLETLKAIDELETQELKSFHSIDALMDDLHADD